MSDDMHNERLNVPTDLMTVTQAAEKWDVSVSTVRTWILRGIIPAEKPGHDWLIPADTPKPQLPMGRPKGQA